MSTPIELINLILECPIIQENIKQWETGQITQLNCLTKIRTEQILYLDGLTDEMIQYNPDSAIAKLYKNIVDIRNKIFKSTNELGIQSELIKDIICINNIKTECFKLLKEHTTRMKKLLMDADYLLGSPFDFNDFSSFDPTRFRKQE